jgi:DDE superfamily endonuclease
VAVAPWDWRPVRRRLAEPRAACHLPKQVRHRPKWQLVLDMLDELVSWGLRPPVRRPRNIGEQLGGNCW